MGDENVFPNFENELIGWKNKRCGVYVLNVIKTINMNNGIIILDYAARSPNHVPLSNNSYIWWT